MARYIVRYEEIYSTIVEADSEEDAIKKVRDDDFRHDDTSEYEAELEEAERCPTK